MSGPTPGARWEVSILLGAHTSAKVQDRDVARRRCNEDAEQPSQFVQVYVHGHHDGYLPPVSSPWLAGRPMRDGQGARVPLQASVLPGSTTLTRSYRRARTSRRRSPAPLPTRGRDLQPEISSSRAPEPCIHTREVTVATREADLDGLTDTHDEPDHHVLAAPTSAFGETSDVKVSRCRWSRAIRGNLGLFIAVVSQISLVSPGIGLAPRSTVKLVVDESEGPHMCSLHISFILSGPTVRWIVRPRLQLVSGRPLWAWWLVMGDGRSQ